MPKVKIPRKSTIVDMTAMCDVAFLLLTFFILATKPIPQESCSKEGWYKPRLLPAIVNINFFQKKDNFVEYSSTHTASKQMKIRKNDDNQEIA